MERYVGSSVCIKNAIFFLKKYKNMRFCRVKSCYFRWACKMKKFRTKIPDLETFFVPNSLFLGFLHQTNLRVSEEATISHGERNITPWCRVSRCEFSIEKWYSGSHHDGAAYRRHPWRPKAMQAWLGWRGHRVRFPPVYQHFSRKYQHPPTDIAAWHSVHRGRSAFWKAFKNQ